ncbi:MAG: FG-GAP-like repeat-containing protein [Tannerella sp.]|nr:FG-GAP-like repeat-containing protein [Tannerella sp.]
MASDATFSASNTSPVGRSRGYVYVFEHKAGTAMWAPCPPVWNQAIYFPLQINEDLTVPAKPQSMLTPYQDANGNEIYPYNGQWIQQPIIKQEAPYVPQVRKPDAEIMDMTVNVTGNTTTVTLLIRNGGSASINAQTPVAFYDGGTDGKLIGASAFIRALPVGVDIFPDEQVSRTFTLSSGFDGHLIWARIMDDGARFPATGYLDCDLENNAFSGSYCRDLIVNLTVTPDSVLCNTTDKVLLTAGVTGITGATTYQWYCNGLRISGSTSQTYEVSQTGEYKCFVTVGPVCRGFTPVQQVTRETPEAVDDHATVTSDLLVRIDVMQNDNKTSYCTPLPEIRVSPLHGTASVNPDGKINYRSVAGYEGPDELTYKIDNSEAKLYLTVTILPDNVIDADCYIPTAQTAWGIKVDWSSAKIVSNHNIPLVGDLDDDGIPEIVCFGTTDEIITPDPKKAKTILIFNGRTHALVNTISLPEYVTAFDAAAYGLVKRPQDRKGLIVVADYGYNLRAYDIDGNSVWTSNVPYGADDGSIKNVAVNIGFADFNNDGYPEVYVRNKIYNASTGKLLVTAPAGSNMGAAWAHFSHYTHYKLSSPLAANVIGDTKLELILGNEIYNVNITDTTGTSGNSMTLNKKLTLPSGIVADGHAQVADFNDDGKLDILVSNRSSDVHNTSNVVVSVYVWDVASTPTSNSIMGTPLSITTGMSGKSIPLIADVNNNGKLDIVIQCDMTGTDYDIRAYEFNAGTFTYLWGVDPNEDSYSNGATLFDFNQDGANEVLISDQVTISIYDGASGTRRADLLFAETTIMQYPVIADVDADGSADIVVCGNNTLNILKSSGTPWTWARPVWNQYMYNSVNVYNDLTIPPVQFNSATVFPGPDGLTGPPNDADDVRPFNNFMQQQTAIFAGGTPIVLTPDMFFTGTPATHYDAIGDSLLLSLHVRNLGDATLQSPLCVAAYRNTASTDNRMGADSLPVAVNVGVMRDITLHVRNLSTYTFDSIFVRVNDRGAAAWVQEECDYTNNLTAFRRSALLMAKNDRHGAVSGIPGRIGILLNDSIPNNCTPAITFAQPAHGEVLLVNDSLQYRSTAGYAGRDTITYTLACNGNTSIARVYVTVAEKPDNISEADCYVPTPTTIWDIEQKAVSNVSIHNLATPFVGDLDGDGRLEVVVPNNDGYPNTANTILVFNDSLRLIQTIIPPTPMPEYNTMTFLIADVDNDHKGEIVVATTNRTLYCYAHDGVLKWGPTAAYVSGTVNDCPSLIVADINSDGYAEILAADKIYDAATGTHLVTLPPGGRGFSSGGPESFMPVFADMDNDGLQEVVAGNTVYRVTISTRAGTAGNSATVLAQINAPAGYASAVDGFTSVADIDLDGDPDVIVTGGVSTTESVFYVWDGATATQIGDTHTFTGRRISRAFAGDINGDSDGRPDIAFTYMNQMEAYSYNPATNAFVQLWKKGTSDGSGATTMSMFDFDQDGKVELVYRDESHLRIIDSNGNNIESILCPSATHTEYPVIVDLDKDGHADILVSGSLTSTYNTPIYLRRFGSKTPDQWAAARSVWNQHAYNATNINEDLSVPRYPVNPATVFAGPDGQLNTPDDVRPYNGFLKQQTVIDRNGIPIWLTPDLKLDGTPVYTYFNDGDSLHITFKVRNEGDAAASAPTWIEVYRNEVEVSNRIHRDSIMQSIHMGDWVTHTVVIPNFANRYELSDNLILRLNDRGNARYEQLECDTINNVDEEPVSDISQTRNDTYTVQKYYWVEEIDVLSNDVLPSSLFSGSFSLLDSIVQPPVAGTLSGVGTGSSSKLIYVNSKGTEGLPANIDSFVYRFRIYDAVLDTVREFRATAYIYILEETHGASACYGRPFTATLKERPSNVTFEWFHTVDNSSLGVGASHNFGALTGEDSRFVKPSVPDATPGVVAPWNREGGFPPGLFTVHASPASPAPMRWTGLRNGDWYNPANWVETVQTAGSTYESPVSWAPSECTNTLIPSDMPYYPELTDSAYCDTITVQNRAMLKNPHALNYRAARVEIRLNSTERDRFVMWSAPLRDMYSGDYHFKDAAGQVRWGDVYMNFFQQANPDPGSNVAVENTFTATFGHPGVALPLGRAFNVKVTSTSLSREKTWIFPQPDDSYDAYTLTRSNRYRFITDGVSLAADTTFSINLPANEDFDLVQVVNPYLAWLDVRKFLEGNFTTLNTTGYLIWDGSIDNDFTAVASYGNRYFMTKPFPDPFSPNLIPPLQSFFVQKQIRSNHLTSVKMSPNWTTTAGGGITSYVLRAAAVENGALRIHAVQGQRNSYALLHHDSHASAEYRGNEDIRTLFYDELPLTVYSLTPLREPLAINASGSFGQQETALGLRVPQAGTVKLAFSGMETFGHNVYLLDRQTGQRTDLQQTPEYSFTVTGQPVGGSGVTEVNERLVLQMEYTGRGLVGISVPAAPAIRCSGLDRHIHVQAVSSVIRRLEIYSVAGALVYLDDAGSTTEYRIPAQSGVYLLKVQTEAGTVFTEKVIVR